LDGKDGAQGDRVASTTELPSYDELPEAPEGGHSAWGLFGDKDNVGLLNLLTPERIKAAAGLIKRGARFPLDAPINGFSPPLFSGRGVPRHHVLHAAEAFAFDDVYDNFFPQGSSQWDALCHVGYQQGAFYNGATEEDILQGRRNTIEHWARRGVAGRAVLLDLARTMSDAGNSYDPGQGTKFNVQDLEMARERSGVEFQTGDILVLHTGFTAWYLGLDPRDRARVARTGVTTGLAQSEDMCRYLWNSHVAAVVTDTYAVEAMPFDRSTPTGFIHRILIGQFGMALGELWWTEDLAADCAQDGVYEMFLTSTPMHAPGGVGSPANAMAIK
jgi:kynurenine formamidase